MAEQKKRPGQSSELGELRIRRQEIRFNDKERNQIEEQAKLQRKTNLLNIFVMLCYMTIHT